MRNIKFKTLNFEMPNFGFDPNNPVTWGASIGHIKAMENQFNTFTEGVRNSFKDETKQEDQIKSDQERRRAGNLERARNIGSNLGQIAGVKNDSKITGLDDASAGWMGDASQAASAVFQTADNVFMGDKNFGAQSAAIDTAVHGISDALMKSGNPWAMLGGAALETANFASKATGQTVQGFDVDINSSGYGDIGHKDSKSNREIPFLFGGLNPDKIERQLQDRNEQAQMALKAQNVSDTIKFEQEARANSIDNVMEANTIALAGGVDTSLLSAKQGGKILRAQDGAKLTGVEISEKENIIPTGELHKNKHDIDLEHITKKGIPVITVDDDSAQTLEDIKSQEGSIQQQAEVESLEVIFNKELTDYIEQNRKKWHESDDSEILLEVGKRLVKELIYNTKDEDNLIQKSDK